jgi:hypothetical protein
MFFIVGIDEAIKVERVFVSIELIFDISMNPFFKVLRLGSKGVKGD